MNTRVYGFVCEGHEHIAKELFKVHNAKKEICSIENCYIHASSGAYFEVREP